MKALDRILRRWRMAKVWPFIPQGARVLDIGCGDGALFRLCRDRIKAGVGLDPALTAPVKEEHFDLIPGSFPESLPETEPFDVITMLAVLEHIPAAKQRSLAEKCAARLKEGGLLLITTPAPMVDHILSLLQTLRLIEGLALEEHYGFDPRQTPEIFTGVGLTLVRAGKFQLGLNNLFIFKKAMAEMTAD